MKYAHFADLHLGAWREPVMRDLSTKAFLKGIDECIVEKMDFILFAGDLFNTSLPSLDTLKIVVRKLRELKEKNVPLYVIAGSHDFSPSGKTMIDVLEQAGLLENVCKGRIDPDTRSLHLTFTQDPKTGVKMAGIVGRKGQLDQRYYENLALEHLEQEEGYKIFMFHTTVSELLARDMAMIESQSLSVFPKGFNYYAGGHIHHPAKVELPDYECVTYPGAMFPNSFAEIEKYGCGGYYVVSTEVASTESVSQKVNWRRLEVCPAVSLVFDVHNKTAAQAMREMEEVISEKGNKGLFQGVIVTLRISGTLSQGRPHDLSFTEIFGKIQSYGALNVMKNTIKLLSQEFEQIMISSASSENMEEDIIREHQGQNSFIADEHYRGLVLSMLGVLNTTKREGETVTDFTRRIEGEMDKMFLIKNE